LCECKDRQLSAVVASYTSQQFSPKITDQQLANVKFPHILEELQNESLSIKTVPALHEIIITYLIDDQQMEIGLRFPSDYPLHGVEIKDLKRVGVQENKWRGWLFNVRQIAQVSDIPIRTRRD
jgi:E3 ubiquitin-protein ligase listerin